MTLSQIQRFFTSSDASSRQAPDWRFHTWAVILLATSSIVPFVHYSYLDPAIYLTRAPFTPILFLVLRSFGELSAWLPAAVVIYWLLAFRISWLRSPGAVGTLAVVLSLCIGFYALYCAGLLGLEGRMHYGPPR